MKLRSRSIILAMALLPVVSFAQFDTGGGSTNGWDGLKLDSKKRIKLDFHNANVDLVIGLLSKATGVTIVKDPALTGGLTITSAKNVSLSEAVDIFGTVLGLKGYDLNKKGNLLVIKQRSKQNANAGAGAAALAAGGGTGFNPGSFNMGAQSNNELRVYPVKYAAASEVARVVNEVFQQSGGTNPFQGFGGGRGGFGGPGGGAQRFMQMIGAGGNQNGPNIRASYDDFSNSVIVNAPSKNQRDVEDLIKKIDQQTDKPVRSKVFPLKYAAATDLTTTIQNVLTNNAPTGRGQTRQNNQGGGFAALFNRGNQNNQQVTADTRSNAVIVTATEDNLKIVADVVAELDKPVQSQNATFVFPLQNARADQIATLLNGAFGSRSGTNPNSVNQARTGTTTSTTNRSTSTNTNRPATLGGQAAPSTDQMVSQSSPDSVSLALKDPTENGGELLTSVTTQGFFGGLFGQQGGGSSSSQTSQSQVGRDESGRLINIRDAVGKVTVISDTNTNSVIVVASPDIADMVKSILNQLDQIPQQVMIETVIVEASLDANTKLGVDWNLAQNRVLGTNKNTSTTAQDFGLTSALQGFKYTITGAGWSAFLNALQTDQKFNVLSTPRIFTSNNVQAVINISQSLPYITSQTVNANGQTTYSTAFLDVGIILTVTPRITSNGYVTMDVDQTANDLQGYTSFNSPIVNQRQATTTVSVKDGETIVLGGIIRSTVSATVNKIPLLGDIPIFGKLFQSSTTDKQKTELLVFLTPHVVRNPEDARNLKDSNIKDLSKPNQDAVKSKLPKPPIPDAGAKGGVQ